jgi:hypothetical protein
MENYSRSITFSIPVPLSYKVATISLSNNLSKLLPNKAVVSVYVVVFVFVLTAFSKSVEPKSDLINPSFVFTTFGVL